MPSLQRFIGNSNGERMTKENIFKEKYGATCKLELLEGGGGAGANQKPLHVEYGYFLGPHNSGGKNNYLCNKKKRSA